MKPVNKQASLFLTRNRRCDTVEEALEGAADHLINGGFKDHMATVFSEGFGPEPFVQIKITIRKDPAAPGCFAYTANTTVSHEIGKAVRLYGLKP